MPMRAAHVTAAILSLALSIPSASATMLITEDGGGKMETYVARFQQVRQSGESVVIDGPCFSACTMVLGIVPPDRICATGNAVLGFHAAWVHDDGGGHVHSASSTRDLMSTYPAPVRALIARHGGLSRKLIIVRGRQLAALVPPCAGGPGSTAVSRTRRAGTVRAAIGTDPRRASFNGH
jgi:hypothetical protein